MEFQFEKDIVLQNNRVLLRPLLVKDFDHLLAVATEDKKLLQYSPTPNHTPELLTEYILKSLEDKNNGIRYPMCIIDKLSNTHAGSTSMAHISNHDKRLEIGWTWLGKSYHRTGLNQNCKLLLLEYVFEKLEFERVEFRTDERNTASRRALEKIGAQHEGTLRSHMLLSDGFRRNTCYYSILKNDWPLIKNKLESTLI